MRLNQTLWRPTTFRGTGTGEPSGAGLRLVATGIAIGLLASLGLSRIIAKQLWGVSPYDPLTLAAVPALLLFVALLACWVPARRAASIDPLIALRHE
jgi:ABC-type antimicrobial peptide transport system permease subunit